MAEKKKEEMISLYASMRLSLYAFSLFALRGLLW
jgi:hypothetical protein